MENKRRPILYKGELYNAPAVRKRPFIPQDPPYDFEECRAKLLTDIADVQDQIDLITRVNRLPTEVVVSLRMRPEYGAKSHFPSTLLQSNRLGQQFEEIGSRVYRIPPTNPLYQRGQEFGKLFFIRTTSEGLDRFTDRLTDQSHLPASFMREIKTIDSFNLIDENEQLSGFDENWLEGNIELVLHPFFQDQKMLQEHFFEKINAAGVNLNAIQMRQIGSSGLTFINFEATQNITDALRGYNPLRTAHPFELRNIGLSERMVSLSGSPKAPKFTEKDRCTLGVIDGGHILGNPAIDNYTEVVEATSAAPKLEFQTHGTTVTAAALYGALNGHRNTDQLTEPLIKVRSFRVLGHGYIGTNPAIVLDNIEKVVRTNTDISIFNLSLGPKRPIWDDAVDSWTVLLDNLSKELNVTFVVAIGNDGDQGREYGRIQTPADMVNGLSVAAYSEVDGIIQRAPYSCFGPGREGAKLKPDLAAFGGCDRNPIHLLAHIPNVRFLTTGTSFATPLTSSAATKLIGASDGIVNALTSRLLLLHSAESESDQHCQELGFGTLTQDLESILTCEGNTYTLIYEAEMIPGKIRKFEIPWTDEAMKGKIRFEWTVITLTAVDDASPIDYTSSSMITHVAPHSKKYRFTKKLPNNQLQAVVVDIQTEMSRAEDLLADGFKQSQLPITEGGLPSNASENELREGLKWDSVDVHNVRKLCKSVFEPALYVEAKTRGRRTAEEKIRFAIVLTVTTSSTEVDLYSEILERFPALVPMQIQESIRISI